MIVKCSACGEAYNRKLPTDKECSCENCQCVFSCPKCGCVTFEKLNKESTDKGQRQLLCD